MHTDTVRLSLLSLYTCTCTQTLSGCPYSHCTPAHAHRHCQAVLTLTVHLHMHTDTVRPSPLCVYIHIHTYAHTSLMSEMWYISLMEAYNSKTFILSVMWTARPCGHTFSRAGICSTIECLGFSSRKCTALNSDCRAVRGDRVSDICRLLCYSHPCRLAILK